MILEVLAEAARGRVAAAKALRPEPELEREALQAPRGTHRFRAALAGPECAFICEVKKASPSKGVIDPVFDYLAIARAYEAAGADAVSCLTEPTRFLGSDAVFREIRKAIGLPMLRKDFTVDRYQILESFLMGADAVLLIMALLDDAVVREGLALCDRLGIDALVEAHDAEEVRRAVSCGARILGVNNRNLKDFTVDVGNAAGLRSAVPAGVLFVAESGIAGPRQAAALKGCAPDACLVGEALMRAQDKGAMLSALREAMR